MLGKGSLGCSKSESLNFKTVFMVWVVYGLLEGLHTPALPDIFKLGTHKGKLVTVSVQVTCRP